MSTVVDLPLDTDGCHFREDSQSRRKLLGGIAHGLHLARQSYTRRIAILAYFGELQRKHRYDPRGRYLVVSRALTESLRKLARPKPTVAEHKEHPTIDHEQPDPWEDEWFEVKREETHAAMPNITTEELAAAVEKREVTRVDQYRWARMDEVEETGELKNTCCGPPRPNLGRLHPQELAIPGARCKTREKGKATCRFGTQRGH